MEMAVLKYGTVENLPFPQVDPDLDEEALEHLVNLYFKKVIVYKPAAIHIMGELTFCLALVSKLTKTGLPCLASTTHRISEVLPNGSKVSKFEFVRFRQYKL